MTATNSPIYEQIRTARRHLAALTLPEHVLAGDPGRLLRLAAAHGAPLDVADGVFVGSDTKPPTAAEAHDLRIDFPATAADHADAAAAWASGRRSTWNQYSVYTGEWGPLAAAACEVADAARAQAHAAAAQALAVVER